MTFFSQSDLKKAEQDLAYAKIQVEKQASELAELQASGLATTIAKSVLRQAELSVVILAAHLDVVREGVDAAGDELSPWSFRS